MKTLRMKALLSSSLLITSASLFAATSDTTGTTQPRYETQTPVAPVVAPSIPGAMPEDRVSPTNTNQQRPAVDRDRRRVNERDDIERKLKQTNLTTEERRTLQSRLDRMSIKERKISPTTPPEQLGLPSEQPRSPR